MPAPGEQGERSVGARRGRRGRGWDSPSRCAPLPRAVRGLRASRALRSLRRRRREGSRRRRGAAQAAPGPGEWSNLTAGTRRRRAGGNGGGGGGAGRHREAWAVTRAPERGPMVLEGPRRPVLQVRRAPAESLCVRGGERLRPAPAPASAPRPAWAPGPGPAGEGSRRDQMARPRLVPGGAACGPGVPRAGLPAAPTPAPLRSRRLGGTRCGRAGGGRGRLRIGRGAVLPPAGPEESRL